MSQKKIPLRTSPLLKILLAAASLVVVAFGMKQAEAVITPILLAFVISILFVPFQRTLQQQGIPAWLALLMVMLLVFAIVILLISITVVSLTSLINRIPEYSSQLQQLIDGLILMADTLPLDLDRLLNQEVFNVGQVMNLTSSLLRGLLDALSNWFFIILLVAFMLSDFARIPSKLRSMHLQESHIQAFSDLFQDIRRYVSITTQTGLLTGILDSLLLLVMGVDFAILWGLLGFIMNYIPNIGIYLSIVPPALLALLKFGWTPMLIVIVGYTAINIFIENILKPRLLGEDLNISPLVVIISLIIWGFILGPAGTVLAVPLTIIAVKVLTENSDSARWLAVLISANPPPAKKETSGEEQTDQVQNR